MCVIKRTANDLYGVSFWKAVIYKLKDTCVKTGIFFCYEDEKGGRDRFLLVQQLLSLLAYFYDKRFGKSLLW
ncbi:hypothetical protein COC52_08760 [Priestia megaterium]|nr:hypothetical protein CN955_04890 [Priestia megaterium]PGR28350.1 hypothetical protein COC52_08760 [Priestia megaterium]